MAYSAIGFASGENTAKNAGKPYFSGPNVLRTSAVRPVWSTSGDWGDSGTYQTGSNADDGTALPDRLYDDFTHLTTNPLTAAVGTYYLLFDLAGDYSPIDHFNMFNHNLGTIAAALSTTISLVGRISNNDDFVTGVDLFTISDVGQTNDRIVAHSVNRYAYVRYLRIAITLAAGNFTSTYKPIIGEMLCGRRYQLSRMPNEPWDPHNQVNAINKSITKSGIGTTVVDYTGKSILSPVWTPIPVDSGSGLDDRQTLLDWWKATKGLYHTFCFDASSPAQNTILALPQSTLSMPYTINNIREIEMEIEEQGPHFLRNEF